MVLNTSDYVAKADTQLSNDVFYKLLSNNPCEQFIIDRILNKALEMEWITKAKYEFLRVEHPVTPAFFLLPKIHKRLVISPGRPIVAGNNSLSQPLNKFVDHLIFHAQSHHPKKSASQHPLWAVCKAKTYI